MPGEVPRGWAVVPIRDLGTIEAGKARAPQASGEWRPYLRCANVHDDRIVADDVLTMPFTDAEFARFQLAPGDILLNEGQSLELVGRPAVYRGFPPNVAIQNSLIRFRPDPLKADAEFGYQLVRWLYQRGSLSAIATQTTSIAHLGVSRFAGVSVPVPPLPEQKKIAAILSSVDEAIRATLAVIDQTRRVKEGLLQDLLTRGLPGHTRFKKTEIGEIPESWEVTTLGELAEPNGLQTGPFGGQLHASDYTEGGVPVVMPKDIVDGKLTDSSVARIPTDLALSGALARHRVREGDVVFGRRGDIGRSALVEASHVGWLCGTGCLRMRPSKRVHPPYLIQRLQHGPSVRWLNEHAVGQTMLNLNTTILGELPLSLPPLSEQVEIARRFEDLDTSASSNAEPLAALLVMKSGLLQDLLTGRVRVSG